MQAATTWSAVQEATAVRSRSPTSTFPPPDPKVDHDDRGLGTPAGRPVRDRLCSLLRGATARHRRRGGRRRRSVARPRDAGPRGFGRRPGWGSLVGDAAPPHALLLRRLRLLVTEGLEPLERCREVAFGVLA